MDEVADKTEVYWEHPRWLHVVIPVARGYKEYQTSRNQVPAHDPLLVAVCPTCFTYVSKKLHYNDNGSIYQGHIDLPQYGCKGPDQ